MKAVVGGTSSDCGTVDSRGEWRDKPALVNEALALEAAAAEPDEADADDSSSGTVVSCGRIETRFVRTSSLRAGLAVVLVLPLVPRESDCNEA